MSDIAIPVFRRTNTRETNRNVQADEHQGDEPQGPLRHEKPLVRVDRSKQGPNALWFDNRGVVPFLGQREGAANIAGRITLRPARGDAVQENLPVIPQGTVANLHGSGTLNPAQHREQFWCPNVCDGALAKPGKQVVLESAQDTIAVAGDPPR